MFNIIIKTIANHMKSILPDIIDYNQSVFVSDKLISYNSLIALEIFHYMT